MSEQSNHNVSLGCGTLILIAIIVSMFSNSDRDVGQEVKQLRESVEELTSEVGELRDEIRGLELR